MKAAALLVTILIAALIGVATLGSAATPTAQTLAQCKIDAAKTFPHGAMMWEEVTNRPNSSQFYLDRNAYKTFVFDCMQTRGYEPRLYLIECQPFTEPDMAFDRWCYRPTSLLGGASYDITFWIQETRCRLNRPTGAPWPILMTKESCRFQ